MLCCLVREGVYWKGDGWPETAGVAGTTLATAASAKVMVMLTGVKLVRTVDETASRLAGVGGGSIAYLWEEKGMEGRERENKEKEWKRWKQILRLNDKERKPKICCLRQNNGSGIPTGRRRRSRSIHRH
jgi:hypothetical protein